MSEALATLTQEAMALPYEEQRELLNSLSVSVRNIERQSQEKDWESLLNSYLGCMGGLWANENPIEYQRRLREDRAIG